ncbi:hypothetical protein KAM622c_40940 [Klebsiella quasipneumoniae subsp. quasipneumoniae]|nr:hypothetical protein KAM622c_40940 [Klebsiella quasipneumoniae subsp. quasipneumoniae]
MGWALFISQLDRGGVPEDRIALIVGHERGKTESFRTYSQGASIKELAGVLLSQCSRWKN